MNTVLFGGSGFLGPIILEKYPEIISIGRSPLPPHLSNRHIPLSTLDNLDVLDSVDFDKVIFLVGSSNHHIINTKPAMGIEYNVLPLKKILNYLQKRKIRKFVCFTTILLYDTQKMKLPVDEKQAINPYINDYVFSKYLSEEVVRYYRDMVPTITVRFSNIYGPTRLIRPDLVPTLIQGALSPNEVTVWNTKPVRDFLYTVDAADAIVRLLDTEYVGPVNLGTGQSVSVGDIAKIIEKLSGKKIKDLGKPVTGPMHFTCDISLVTRLTGWRPKYSIRDGLTKTYERMREYADECRWWEAKKP